jgi:hypothetical protein
LVVWMRLIRSPLRALLLLEAVVPLTVSVMPKAPFCSLTRATRPVPGRFTNFENFDCRHPRWRSSRRASISFSKSASDSNPR